MPVLIIIFCFLLGLNLIANRIHPFHFKLIIDVENPANYPTGNQSDIAIGHIEKAIDAMPNPDAPLNNETNQCPNAMQLEKDLQDTRSEKFKNSGFFVQNPSIKRK